MSKAQNEQELASLKETLEVVRLRWTENNDYERTVKEDRIATLNARIAQVERRLDADRIHPHAPEAWDTIVFEQIAEYTRTARIFDSPAWVTARDAYYAHGDIQPLLDLAKHHGWEFAETFEVKRVVKVLTT